MREEKQECDMAAGSRRTFTQTGVGVSNINNNNNSWLSWDMALAILLYYTNTYSSVHKEFPSINIIRIDFDLD